MDSSYNQSRIWMNSRGVNNSSSNNWGGFLSGRDPLPGRSSLSLAGWPQYENAGRRPLMSSDMSAASQRSAVSRWSRDQPVWDGIRGGGPQTSLNSWSGSSNGNPRAMQNQPQQQQSVQMQSNNQEPPQEQAEGGFLQGFNSAAREWFYRYLNMGCSPEEARDRVLERNRNYPESLGSNPNGGRCADAQEQVERRTQADERRRPPESASDSIANVLRSLSGACRKWYNKHLENGFTPDEAIAKVLEHRKTHSGNRADTGGRKRPVDGNAKNDDPKKPKNGKEATQAETVSVAKNSLAVSIVAKNYPKYHLMKSELTNIEEALLEEMKNGWTCSLNFEGIKYGPGMMVVTCLDEGSKEWLEHVVPKITAVYGVPLAIYKENNILNSKGITFFVPDKADEPDDVTMRFIKEQNTDLLSGNWTIVRDGTSKSKNGKVMTLQVDDKSLDLLNKRGMTISYRFVQLRCHISQGAVFLPSKKKKNAAKEAPANLPAIDLTAEDEEIEFSELTVLDEVVCDDEGDEGDEIAEEDENGNGEQQNEEEIEQ